MGKKFGITVILTVISMHCSAMGTKDDPNIFNNPKLRASIMQWIDTHIVQSLLNNIDRDAEDAHVPDLPRNPQAMLQPNAAQFSIMWALKIYFEN